MLLNVGNLILKLIHQSSHGVVMYSLTVIQKYLRTFKCWSVSPIMSVWPFSKIKMINIVWSAFWALFFKVMLWSEGTEFLEEMFTKKEQFGLLVLILMILAIFILVTHNTTILIAILIGGGILYFFPSIEKSQDFFCLSILLIVTSMIHFYCRNQLSAWQEKTIITLGLVVVSPQPAISFWSSIKSTFLYIGNVFFPQYKFFIVQDLTAQTERLSGFRIVDLLNQKPRVSFWSWIKSSMSYIGNIFFPQYQFLKPQPSKCSISEMPTLQYKIYAKNNPNVIKQEEKISLMINSDGHQNSMNLINERMILQRIKNNPNNRVYSLDENLVNTQKIYDLLQLETDIKYDQVLALKSQAVFNEYCVSRGYDIQEDPIDSTANLNSHNFIEYDKVLKLAEKKYEDALQLTNKYEEKLKSLLMCEKSDKSTLVWDPRENYNQKLKEDCEDYADMIKKKHMMSEALHAEKQIPFPTDDSQRYVVAIADVQLQRATLKYDLTNKLLKEAQKELKRLNPDDPYSHTRYVKKVDDVNVSFTDSIATGEVIFVED